jgi:hypothetical protein
MKKIGVKKSKKFAKKWIALTVVVAVVFGYPISAYAFHLSGYGIVQDVINLATGRPLINIFATDDQARSEAFSQKTHTSTTESSRKTSKSSSTSSSSAKSTISSTDSSSSTEATTPSSSQTQASSTQQPAAPAIVSTNSFGVTVPAGFTFLDDYTIQIIGANPPENIILSKVAAASKYYKVSTSLDQSQNTQTLAGAVHNIAMTHTEFSDWLMIDNTPNLNTNSLNDLFRSISNQNGTIVQ